MTLEQKILWWINLACAAINAAMVVSGSGGYFSAMVFVLNCVVMFYLGGQTLR